MDIQALMALIPHRYPFLLVDRIVDICGDESAIGIKNVSANEPQFTGHFPGRPIMPGVLLIEGMAQTAGAICALAMGLTQEKTIVYFMTIDQAKFRRPVVPGDQVLYHVSKLRNRRNIWKFACTATVDGDKVAEAVIGAMVDDVPEA